MTQHDVPVEIKVNLTGVESALRSLGFGEGKRRSVWFLEDLTPGLASATPILATGVIVRFRSTEDSGDDSTVKLRPCRWSQLSPSWSVDDKGRDREYRIEADWAGTRRALAASYQLSLDEGAVAAAIEHPSGTPLFDERQQQLLDDCAPTPINLAALTPLGPIDAVRWKDVDLGGIEVDAEQWQLDGLEFLEVSIRVGDATTAVGKQQELERVLRDSGVTFAQDQQPKTTLVLERLVSKAR